MLNLKKFFRSFGYAFRGFSRIFREEQNFRFQLLGALFILALAYYFKIENWELIVLLLVITLVLVLEALNTIFERLSDLLKPRLHDYVKTIKDVMCATVLMAVIAAVIIGWLIFWPYIKLAWL